MWNVKYASGEPSQYAINAFPVRSNAATYAASGAWLVAYHDEQSKHLQILPETRQQDSTCYEEKPLTRDTIFSICCTSQMKDICVLNIMGEQFNDIDSEDLDKFVNLESINANENFLTLSNFSIFPALQSLEIQLNAIRNINISPKQFNTLKFLDMSYNNISNDDILQLGKLSSLTILKLTGNNLNKMDSSDTTKVFPELTELYLDDNNFNGSDVFLFTCRLPRLRVLDLSKNCLREIPQIKLLDKNYILTKPRKKGIRTKSATPKNSPRVSTNTIVENNLAEEKITEETASSLNDELSQLGIDDLKIDLEKFEIDNEETNVEELKQNQQDFENILDEMENQDKSEYPLPPPFSELTLLNLSSNLIKKQNEVLPCAAWASLTTINLINNPLVKAYNGTPPLLKRMLTDRLGVKIIRTEQEKTRIRKDETMPIKFSNKKNRRITVKVPTIPRCDVEKLLALETAKNSSSLSENEDSSVDENEKPGFFITSAGEIDSTRGKPSQDNGSQNPSPEPVHTQLSQLIKNGEENKQIIYVDKNESDKIGEDRYKGYEELIANINSEDENSFEALPVQSNLANLRQALEHPLVYRDEVKNFSTKQAPLRKFELSLNIHETPPIIKTRQQKIDELLEELKLSNNVIEANLSDVLKNPEMRKNFKAARKLFKEAEDTQRIINAKSVSPSQSPGPKGRISSLKKSSTNSSIKLPPII